MQKYAPIMNQNRINLLTDTPHNKKKRREFIEHYRQKEALTNEESEALGFFKNHRYSSFPFKWSLKYDRYFPDIYLDETNSFHYVMFEGKKLYFPKKYSPHQIIWTVRSILKEQDVRSAHLYLTSEFQIEEETIMIDGGVAEGSLPLSLIEKLKQLYLIECNLEWIEALNLTFAPWRDKVEIIGKYLSDTTNDQNVCIDELLEVKEDEKYFVKIDVEGYEKLALKGMTEFFQKVKKLKMCLCTYHKENDAKDLEQFVIEKKLIYEFSDSHLLYDNEDKVPTFRKALIRAKR
jgi:hypothetical protein